MDLHLLFMSLSVVRTKLLVVCIVYLHCMVLGHESFDST